MRQMALYIIEWVRIMSPYAERVGKIRGVMYNDNIRKYGNASCCSIIVYICLWISHICNKGATKMTKIGHNCPDCDKQSTEGDFFNNCPPEYIYSSEARYLLCADCSELINVVTISKDLDDIMKRLCPACQSYRNLYR